MAQSASEIEKYILAVNAGSSSLKCRVFDTTASNHGQDMKQLVSVKISDLNSENPSFDFDPKPENHLSAENVSTHEQAFVHMLKQFRTYANTFGPSDHSEIAVVHRVVHGGNFKEPVEINHETFHYLEKLETLAPLHNAPALAIIRSCSKEMPDVRNVAVFDTSFHKSIPAAVGTYAIDPELADRKQLRKYGFHGISYQYILRRVSWFLKKSQSSINLIALHLGAGSSICAIHNGASIDTSMGLTPVSGLPGASRCGDIDPSLVFHMMSSAAEPSHALIKGLHITRAEELLNKQSGWKALTGTADFAEIAKTDAPAAHKLAFDIFVDRVSGYIGSYYVKLKGKVDAIVFSGGIGESSVYFRAQVLKRVECLGIFQDVEKNRRTGASDVWEISGEGIRVLVCKTDEESEMAQTLRRNVKRRQSRMIS